MGLRALSLGAPATPGGACGCKTAAIFYRFMQRSPVCRSPPLKSGNDLSATVVGILVNSELGVVEITPLLPQTSWRLHAEDEALGRCGAAR